ncbi:MAG: glucosyltransferase domain-containing protein [Acetatifactor sp.]|nr:glucosyltransferase domain-containing protein [Acetatifactor sp.]
MMKRFWNEIRCFLESPTYIFSLLLTAIFSYGFRIFQPSIGIDDTAVELYLQDGLEVVMGRWTVFLLNKVFHVAEYAPFMLEMVGVIFLMLGATLFCVLIKRCMGGTVTEIGGYAVFACIFISDPIISEVFIYYYHDGVGLGYILTALSLLAFEEALERENRKVLFYLSSMLFIWAAVGCYESFLVLYILGILVVIFLHGIAHRDKMKFLFLAKQLTYGALLVVGCMILRQIMIPLMTEVFDLHNVVGLKSQRGLSEMLVLFRGREGWNTFLMLLKRFWVVYYINAVCYLPVTGYVAAICCVGAVAIALAIMRKNLWYLVLWIGMLIAPFLLTLAEAHVTLYRSCQYLPFFTALGAFMVYFVLKRGHRYLRYGVMIIAVIITYNQATEMNRNFYINYQKYEHTKDVLLQVAYEVEKEYGVEKPIVFTGHYDVPYEFVKDYYVGYGSWQYQWIVKITDPVDPHLKEKYFTPYGYSFVGEAQNPFIQWGLDAFDGTSGQMIRFLSMHGHTFQTVTDKETLEEAQEQGDNMPRWPMEGSIAEQESYILIHM